jgi:predicted RNA-binding Zn ribbon-like protein
MRAHPSSSSTDTVAAGPTDSARAFPLLANLLCLDFVNTEVISQGRRTDLLADFGDLIRWAQDVALVPDGEARAIVRAWGGTRQGAAALAAGRALRQALRTLAEDLAEGRAVSAAVLPALNDVLAAGASVLRVERHGGAYETRRHLLQESASSVLVPVAESAAWLLERGDRTLVRRCENPACILYFYDTTKNKRRRWCAMEGCGSRAKAAAYYRRTRAAQIAGTARR